MKRVVEWFAGVLCVLVLAAILFPVFAQTKSRHRPMCLRNLKQTSAAMLIYVSDSDGFFPSRDEWLDALQPYAKHQAQFRCPKAQKEAWGYAFNAAFDRLSEKKVKSPDSTPMIYDSVNPMRNASDLITSLPAVPRHGRNYMAYTDGHANALLNSAGPPTSQ